MKNKLNIAVVGATGIVGNMIVSILEERNFPVDNLYLLASKNSLGKSKKFKNSILYVEELSTFNFNKVDLALFSAGEMISKIFVPIAVSSGCIVIDNTSYFRYHSDVPLIIPEINSGNICNYKKSGIIANPNCSTIQMLIVLKPLYDNVGIVRVNISTYQSVSGSGKKAIKELITQIRELLNGKSIQKSVYSQQIAFNVLPHIDKFQDNGYTFEELKMIIEAQKIMEDKTILINPTAVRVPILYGHSATLNIELKRSLSISKIRKILNNFPNIEIIDNIKSELYPTPISHAIGNDNIFVGRIRKDLTNPNSINLWIVFDNIRKGAATNVVQIAEILYDKYL